MKVREAWELPEVADLPEDREYIALVKQMPPDCPEDCRWGRHRAIYKVGGEYIGGRWTDYRAGALRISVDGDRYEGRVTNPGDALFAVMRLRENREPTHDSRRLPILISVEEILTARHRKMTKVSE